MKKILIIDDDTETLELLKRILYKNFHVAILSDVNTLEQELNDHRPDLIIIDHFIGCTNSQEIISDFKKQDKLKNIPVIIHSGHEQIEQIAMSANAAGYLKKPASIAEIRTFIDTKLGQCS